MATTIYLIRYGETVNGEVKRYKGTYDVMLSGKGVKQMEMVTEYLSKLLFKGQEVPN